MTQFSDYQTEREAIATAARMTGESRSRRHREAIGEATEGYVGAAMAAGGDLSQVKPEADHRYSTIVAVRSEEAWLALRRPYFKVYPRIGRLLSEVTFDMEAFRLRVPYAAFAVHFPLGEWRERPDAPALASVLFCVHNPDAGEAGRRLLSFAMQFDAPTPGTFRRQTVVHAATLRGDFRLEEFVDAASETLERVPFVGPRPGYHPGPAFVEAAERVCLAVCFFGTNRHALICPDLPARFARKREAAVGRRDAARVAEIDERFGRGFKVGAEIELPRPVAAGAAPADAGRDGRALTHAHLRRAHMRMQPVGPKDAPHFELVFVSPSVVRPDLPFQAAPAAGYRITDKLLANPPDESPPPRRPR